MDETHRTTDDDHTRWQQPLPFDDEADWPAPYVLTTRARRTVAPDDVPDLTVVARATPSAPDEGALEDPGDTRPARARALRRAGTVEDAIARILDVDELTVRAWLGDLAGRTRCTEPPTPLGEKRGGAGASRVFERAREQALAQARERLATDPAFAAGLGLVSGIADVDAHSVSLRTNDVRVAATVVQWLQHQAGASAGRFRVVLRLAPADAADLARHHWAEVLDLPLEQIAHTRTRHVAQHAEEALVRLADPAVAGAVSGWTEALLRPPSPEPADAAF